MTHLNSEYRTHYKWHDGTNATYQGSVDDGGVSRRPESVICSEPAIPRRKKHPEFAYRTHEVLGMVNSGDSSDSLDTETFNNIRDLENRARSEERNLQIRDRVNPRSKSVDPYFGRRRPVSACINPKGEVHSILNPVEVNQTRFLRHQATNPIVDQLMTRSCPPAVHVPTKPTIRKTTEYRSQFAWPSTGHWMNNGGDSVPRKSISMGAIQGATSMANTSRKGHGSGSGTQARVGAARDSSTMEESQISMKRVVNQDSGKSTRHERRHVKLPADKGLWEGAVKAPEETIKRNQETVPSSDNDVTDTKPKKIKTEYKSKFKAPAKYAYVEGTWKKMSRSADSESLQLEEPSSLPWYGEVVELRKKAGEYKYRSMGSHIAPEQLAAIYSRQEVYEQLSSRSHLSALALATAPSTWKVRRSGGNDTPLSLQSSVRHHLERTTPAPGETGVLIMSPTRDHKLEPAETKKSGREVVKTKTSPSKVKPGGNGKISGRSASAGVAQRSPKRTPRPASMIVSGSKSQVGGVVDELGDSVPTKKVEVKRPRPTTLATSSTTMARPKTVPSIRAGKVIHSVDEGVPKVHGVDTRSCPVSSSGISRPASTRPATTTVPSAHTSSITRPMTSSSKPVTVPSVSSIHSKPRLKQPEPQPEPPAQWPLISTNTGVVMMNGDDKGGVVENGAVTDESREIEETLMMKSPPEPTRVKSPEQILVRSPEPVKWTIPLETGIKWTGTPKLEGENLKTSSYEGRTPPSVSSPIESPTSSLASHDMGVLTSPRSGEARSPVGGSITSPSSSRSLASDVLEKARTRFDQFWGKSKEKEIIDSIQIKKIITANGTCRHCKCIWLCEEIERM